MRTEWIGIPPGPWPPRTPGTTSLTVGSGAQSSDASLMASTVVNAVPDGASTLRSW